MRYPRPNPAFLKSIGHPARCRIAPLGRWPLLALPLAALLGGCAGTPAQTTSSDYYRDAQLCHAQNTAGPQAQIDKTEYLHCMARLGWKQEAGTDPLLKSLEKCRAEAEHPMSARRKSRRPQPSTGFDQAAYQECLRQRGVQGDLAAEPVRTPRQN
jgi:hypothetical protein